MKKISIGNKIISDSSPVFIIAELSCNHGGKLDIALETIDAMYEAGADCVKLQTSKPNSITIDSRKDDFIIKGGTLWDNKTLFELYKEVQTPWEWHEQIRNYVESKGMVFFSSPFDFEAVDFLEDLNVPAYKIASFEITDIPLIKYTASKGKPIIMSTGIATEDDIKTALKACHDVGNEEVILLKCTSAYPTPLEEVNLKTITDMKYRFKCHVGLSDHTIGSIVPIGAVSLGAKVIEKHFILNREIESADAKFSMLPEEFKQMVDSIRSIEKSMGVATYELSDRVKKNKNFARSLYIVEDVKKGEKLAPNNVRSIRPGFGLHPKHYEGVLGKKFTRDFEKGTALTLEMFS